MSNVTRINPAAKRLLPRQVAARDLAERRITFLDDLAGYVWQLKITTRLTWDQLGAKAGVCGATLMKLAARNDYKRAHEATQHPRFDTIFGIGAALVKTDLINERALREYGKFGRREAQALDKKLGG